MNKRHTLRRFTGALLNYAENMLRSDWPDDKIAILFRRVF